MKAPCLGSEGGSFIGLWFWFMEELACTLFAVVLGSAPWGVLTCPLSFLALSEISSKESDFLGACTSYEACILLLDI